MSNFLGGMLFAAFVIFAYSCVQNADEAARLKEQATAAYAK